jgi:hypothetical protein
MLHRPFHAAVTQVRLNFLANVSVETWHWWTLELKACCPWLRTELQSLDCVSVAVLMVCAHVQSASQRVVSSRQGATKSLHRRKAALKHPDAECHPVYASQKLFSMYVHAQPGFDGHPRTSIFHGREIAPQVRASHRLAR